MRKIYLLLIAFGITYSAMAQETFPVNGPHNKNHNYYAFTNAKIHVDYQTVIEKGTLLIKDGKIVKVSAQLDIPAAAVVYDLKGKSIYPSLIDIYSTYGMPEVKKATWTGNPQMESNLKGPFSWNQAIKPETEASRIFNVNNESAEELRKLGFGSVLSIPKDGIARGSSVFTTLANDKENNIIIKPKAAAHYSFDKGSSTQDYPSSLMGSIALLRQTYYDAQWYTASKTRKENNISLEAWTTLQSLPQIFEVNDKLSALRADKVGDEFNIQYIIKGSGDEYQRLDEIKSTNASFILPINFPAPFDVEDPLNALMVTLGQMKHWEMAPGNPAAMEKKGISFALTSSDIKEKKDFWVNLHKAVDFGLSEKEALKALTHTPANMIGVADKVGSLKEGMLANFIVTSGNLFDKKNILHENWIQGKQHIINDYNVTDIRGNYNLTYGSQSMQLKITGDVTKPEGDLIKIVLPIDTVKVKAEAKAKGDTVKTKVNVITGGNLVTISFNVDAEGQKGMVRLSGSIDRKDKPELFGKGQMPDGTWINWNANYVSSTVKEEKKDTIARKNASMGDLTYPNLAYGWKELPKTETVLIKGATVWTNEKEGILNETDVLISNGKISQVGKGLQATGAKVIEGKGKHLSAGIIDEHSHIAIQAGVNEGGQASSSEVRIGDVVSSDDVDIYRQLAGGVTASQLLHGSANPIGGQSALIKLRWGQAPEKMKIDKVDGFIKFALGENVKQSNWGDKQVVRYPQTRMGVEQVFYDEFIRAKEYETRWNKFNIAKVKSGDVPRRDLELDALVEILNKKRFITCHSYVQSEINMLMHVADSMGFKINTFTHILEGYKVADKMKKHGVGGSTFSDWWAYKMEVNDAIPHNGAIMHKMGIVTAFNSDDAEMARRLNQEAAKAVKYGNVSEEEALKFVTLNPAKLLHVDDRMGSIKTGKDADVVLWSDNPLSIYAKAEKTFVDGILYYDIERDQTLRQELQKERARLIQKMISEKQGGAKTQKPEMKAPKYYHCETIELDYMEE